jgi:antitoxin (DNA-binding transcriptional repressor) of toxin-antitoxin stability system
MTWKVAQAKQNLSKLLRAAADEPQTIYNRDHLVAAVIAGDTLTQFESWCREQERRRPLAEVFQELRQICADEDFEFPQVPRHDRPNPFVGDDE